MSNLETHMAEMESRMWDAAGSGNSGNEHKIAPPPSTVQVQAPRLEAAAINSGSAFPTTQIDDCTERMQGNMAPDPALDPAPNSHDSKQPEAATATHTRLALPEIESHYPDVDFAVYTAYQTTLSPAEWM